MKERDASECRDISQILRGGYVSIVPRIPEIPLPTVTTPTTTHNTNNTDTTTYTRQQRRHTNDDFEDTRSKAKHSIGKAKHGMSKEGYHLWNLHHHVDTEAMRVHHHSRRAACGREEGKGRHS